MTQRKDKWERWYEMFGAAKSDSTEKNEIAAAMENHHVRASIVNRSPYDENKLLKVAERALDSAQRALGKSHPRTAEAIQNLGFYYLTFKKDSDKAIDFFQEACALAGDRNPVLALTYCRLGVYFYHEQDFIKAEDALQEALAIQRMDPNVDAEELSETLFILSYVALITQGVEVSIDLVTEAYNTLKASFPESDLLADIKGRMDELRQE